ncbi:MAG: glycosyltransferase family 4 protein, partial [Actinobacteria bacterium]|nr:glycosyltransferase family 4 protein [Actinomycetota bacterium]NIS28672.1 glycosyltransferase family 4 protein [Actinomycetota bacterium]NIU64129.1 glycosyltransferase family 4 protein [Actinomycetota bacterium]
MGRPSNLVVVGHGELESELRHHVAVAGLTDRVVMIGGVDRPEAWIARADLFVLAS